MVTGMENFTASKDTTPRPAMSLCSRICSGHRSRLCGPGGEPYVLQQDNAPQHTARLTKAWLAEHREQIKILDWPAISPDLNTMENAWALMAQELTEDSQCGRHPTVDQLWTQVQHKWGDLCLRPALFETLAESMERRLQSVVDAAGDCTKY